MNLKYFIIIVVTAWLVGLYITRADATTVDLDQQMPDPLLYVHWDDGTGTCIRFPTSTGVRFDTPSFVTGETLQQYITRASEVPVFPVDIKIRCDAMIDKYAGTTWTIVPLSNKRPLYPKPIYKLAGFPANRVEIGRVRPGTLCGRFVKAYSKTIKVLTWREITINNTTGVSVCKKGVKK